MPKKPINTNVDSPLTGKVSKPTVKVKQTKELSDKVLFSPTAPQQKVKARFWTRFRPGPYADPSNISESMALQVTGSASIRRWWSQPGFVEWFRNREEERERLKYLFNKSLDTLEEILGDPSANPTSKINGIKLLAEMNGYLNKTKQEEFADDSINKMSEQQLKEFISRNGIKIVEEKIIETIPEKEQED